jgi:hypothetical protein
MSMPPRAATRSGQPLRLLSRPEATLDGHSPIHSNRKYAYASPERLERLLHMLHTYYIFLVYNII